MRRFFAALVVATVATAASPSSSPAADKATEGDLKKLQGQWTTNAGPNNTPVTLVFDDAKVSIRLIAPTGDEMTISGDLALDETTTPRAMTWTHVKVKNLEPPDLLAIYAFEGDDSLKIAGVGGNTRPKEFIEKGKELPGIRPNTLVFTRVKDEPKK